MKPIESVQSGTPMPASGEDSLVVRRHERLICRLPATVSVSSDSEVRLALSRTVGDGAGRVPAMVVDCSEGGAGLECGCFVPRGATVVLKVPVDGSSEAIECRGTIQRVTMISRGPTYYLGVSFAEAGSPANLANVERLLGACKAATGREGADARA